MATDRLEGDVAVVTGGASGIGRAIALGMAAEGADIVVADIREEPREGGIPTHDRIVDDGGRARHVACDVTERADHETAMDTAEDLGGVTVMVNNAGIFSGDPIGMVAEETLDELLAVNVKGTYFGAQAAANRMGSGSIINLSSIAGLRGSSLFSVYSTTKGAVRAMTYALAAELSPSIRVNALHPGLMETTMTTEDVPLVDGLLPNEEAERRIPAGRFGRPDDVVGAAVALASDEFGYVTGASLPVDGGLANTVVQ